MPADAHSGTNMETSVEADGAVELDKDRAGLGGDGSDEERVKVDDSDSVREGESGFTRFV